MGKAVPAQARTSTLAGKSILAASELSDQQLAEVAEQAAGFAALRKRRGACHLLSGVVVALVFPQAFLIQASLFQVAVGLLGGTISIIVVNPNDPQIRGKCEDFLKTLQTQETALLITPHGHFVNAALEENIPIMFFEATKIVAQKLNGTEERNITELHIAMALITAIAG